MRVCAGDAEARAILEEVQHRSCVNDPTITDFKRKLLTRNGIVMPGNLHFWKDEIVRIEDGVDGVPVEMTVKRPTILDQVHSLARPEFRQKLLRINRGGDVGKTDRVTSA